MQKSNYSLVNLDVCKYIKICRSVPSVYFIIYYNILKIIIR